ncbi:GRP family sugar transporter [Sporolactobacillus shoreicorticis]|uniref:GRP family sugar transporter n=1 Tax=Sporolactobacillus shoreicorticis TaxID=1923877 RepID=A0ABW5S6U0_9BACL|nr:GRP family sugar transporter [Sporolactobacillus shoreicorticis]MCO7126644.1 GRP family sugar transporter [Sporolactobacillus shoreicorticis]
MEGLTGLMISLIPALLWGTLPLVSAKVGGTPHHQVFGMTIGALFFSMALFFFIPPQLNAAVISVSLLSGLFWAVGQFYQFAAMKILGVSKTMPLSTGMQLAGVALCGIFIFREWDTAFRMIIGLSALALIVIGVLLTSRERRSKEKNTHPVFKGLVLLAVSTFGYISYLVILRLFRIDGWSAILPQSIGMIIGAVILSGKKVKMLHNRHTAFNIISGLMWAGGNLALLIATKLEGVAISFSMSQIGTVLSTLGGIFILGEKKTKNQMVFLLIGCTMIIFGGVLLGKTKN